MNLGLRALAGLAGVVLLSVGLGCNKTDTPPAPAPGVTTNPGTPTASTGQELFQQHCAKCHRTGAKGKGAPDLSKTGADPAHTAEWIAEHIKNPTAHTAESKMPAFEGKLTAEQIRMLAEYILGLKS